MGYIKISMNNTFISLDLSSVSSGYCVFKDGEQIEFGCIKNESVKPFFEYEKSYQKSDEKRRKHLPNLRKKIEDLIIKYKPRYLVKETGKYYRNLRTAFVLGTIHGCIEQIEIPMLNIEVSDWQNKIKSIYSGVSKNKAKKKKEGYFGFNCFLTELNTLPDNDDIADAFCIGFYHINYQSDGYDYESLKKMKSIE